MLSVVVVFTTCSPPGNFATRSVNDNESKIYGPAGR